MSIVEKNLERREKTELIAIITHMLRQEPELQWLLETALQLHPLRKPRLTQRCTGSRFWQRYRQETTNASTNVMRFREGWQLSKGAEE